MLLITISCQSKHEINTRDILEADIPRVVSNIKNIYVWEGEDYREYDVKRVPVTRDVCKLLNISELEIPYVHYLYDAAGKKTPFFIGCNDVAIGQDSISLQDYAKIDGNFIQTKLDVDAMFNDMVGTFLVALYKEQIDEEGKYEVLKIAYVSDLIGDRWKVTYTNASKDGELQKEKEYMFDFNKNYSSIFLNLIPEEDPMIEQRRLLDSLMMDRNK